MEVSLTAEAGGDTFIVTTSLGDMVALEEQFDIAVSDLQTKQKMGWMVFLAWHAASRVKKTSLDLDAFKAAVDTIEVSDPAGDDEGKDEEVRRTGLPG